MGEEMGDGREEVDERVEEDSLERRERSEVSMFGDFRQLFEVQWSSCLLLLHQLDTTDLSFAIGAVELGLQELAAKIIHTESTDNEIEADKVEEGTAEKVERVERKEQRLLDNIVQNFADNELEETTSIELEEEIVEEKYNINTTFDAEPYTEEEIVEKKYNIFAESLPNST